MADHGRGHYSSRVQSRGEDSPADRLWWYGGTSQPLPPARPPRPRWFRRERPLDAIACLTVATLCFSQACRETLVHANWGFYNRTPLSAPILVALVASIVALAAVGFLGVRVIRRLPSPAWRRPAAATAAAVLLVALNFVRLTYETLGRWVDAIGPLPWLALVALTLALSLARPAPALRLMRRVVLATAPLAAVTLVLALWMFLEVAAGPVWRLVDPAPLKTPAPSLRRVVWLVLEELDQRITFEARPAGLELPELDRLRRESLYADAARPPAGV
ncbi:MAG TPA: hypothetical protein VFX28_25345, partial [Methylomirabilota bacterium]|nr:hypothetical protein [Methylomirabilota bacterium]